MPPFRSGLQKRKIYSKAVDVESDRKNAGNSNYSSDEDLLKEVPESALLDDTDSEHEKSDSDGEQQEVLFSDGNSSIDEDDGIDDEEGSNNDDDDESSDLTDSEADDDSDDEASDSEQSGNQSGEAEENSFHEQSDSESGIGHTHSDSSDDGRGKFVKLKPALDTEEKGKRVKSKVEDIKSKTRAKKIVKNKQDKRKDSVEALADKIKETSVKTKPVVQKDEYSSGDTSDEEGRVVATGSVPAWWYDEYPHVGYDVEGRRVMRPAGAAADAIDQFLKQCEDPDYWRTVRDPSTGQQIVLSAADLELIARLRSARPPRPEDDDQQDWVEWFSGEVLATPVRAFPEHKRSFLPSREDAKHIGKIVHALRMGWAKTRKQIAKERKKSRRRRFYDLWGNAGPEQESVRAIHRHIPAPRRPPPSHAESYNPPPEYLLDSKEMKEWDKLSETPWKRKYTFLPTQYPSLRAVPAYPRYVRERFLRCLDLYLAPRAIKMRLTIKPEDLVPSLPSPRDLQPFPTRDVLTYKGHTDIVRSVDIDPSGQYAVSGSDDCCMKVWEVATGRCLRTVKLEEAVVCVSWIPTTGLSLVAVASGNKLMLVNPGADIGAHRVATATDALLEEAPPQHDVSMDARTSGAVQWEKVNANQWALGVRICVSHFRPLAHVAWHAKGDYLVATVRDGASRSVVVHQLSRRRSQLPFSKAKGLVQCAVFHTHKPLLFVATQRCVRVYDLVKGECSRVLRAGAQWISNLAVHPSGDHLLVSSYDRKVAWFDLELSSAPYTTLRLHGRAVRSVVCHPRYPLFASAGDDPYIVVSHATVYNDLLQNPLIVPLKQLGAPAAGSGDGLSVLSLRFHPHHPWLLAACADHTMRLYS